LRVLTFNSHQPYLHLLAGRLPWHFGVVAPKLPTGQVKQWNTRIRPLLDNIAMYSSVQEALQDGVWDWVLAHNINDLLDSRSIPIPKAFLVHGTLTGRILQDRSNIDRALYLKNLRILLNACGARVIYISELKRRDWGIPGDVIRPAVDVNQYGKYRGEISGVLQVCNRIRDRGAMMGWSVYEAVCQNIPSLVLGENPGLPCSRMSNDWEDLKEQLRSYRVYLYTPAYPYEDGYNLALLEAMATGMPVATLPHPTSPVRDGLEGVVSADSDALRKKIIELLECPEEAFRLGAGARLRVETEFAVSDFQRAWEAMAVKLLR
jgi:hypothetical protein